MRGPAENALRACAAALAAIFFYGAAAELVRPQRGPADGRGAEGAAFHSGKGAQSPAPDPACQARGCHPPSPHRKDAATAAFLNMHGSSVECFACHGRDAWSRIGAAEGAGAPGRTIRCPLPPGTVEPHTVLGKPTPCRGCHSEEGVGRLAARGVGGFGPGFRDPMPLRMIERGTKRWDPAGIR